MVDAVSARELRVQRGPRVVLDDVTWSTSFGTVSAILGPNGAGKSTLLKAILGILPCSGDVHLSGQRVRDLDHAARAHLAAYVPQRSELSALLPVESVVAQGRYAHGLGLQARRASNIEAIQAALHATDTTPLVGRAFAKLSYGERQRVLVARALATGAKILLLDEPSASLDIGHALRLYALLRRLAGEGYGVVVALHPLAEALQWTDNALLLQAGRVIQSGRSSEVIAPGRLEAVYDVRLVPSGALGFELPTNAHTARLE